MAWGAKYRFHIYSHSVGTYWRVDLAQADYVGSVSEALDVAEDSLLINLEGRGGEKFFTSSGNVLKGTSASISICVDSSGVATAMAEFATVDEQEWKMLIYKGTAPGNETLYHELFVQPDVYNYPYSDYPYFVTIRASDEVGRLNSMKFMNGLARYTSRQSLMYFIFEITGKLGISRELREGCNVYSTEMSSLASASPLMQATVDPTKYLKNVGRENEEAWNCHEVLNDLLKPFGIVMHLGRDNRWLLRRVNEAAADSYTERTISDATTVDSNATVSSHIKQTNSEVDTTIVTLINEPMVRVDWRWKRATLKYYVGNSGNFVFNGDLAPSAWFNINTLTNWTKLVSPPANNYAWTYERTQPLTEVYYLDGTEYGFVTDTENNRLRLTTAGTIFEDGDRVILVKDNSATMPGNIDNNRPYYVVNSGTEEVVGVTYQTIQLAQLSGTTPSGITSVHSGNVYIGALGIESIDYAVQLNDHVNNLWSGSGAIQNNSGLQTPGTDVLQQSGNTFTLSFYWRLNPNNNLERQTNAGYIYYAVTVTTSASTVYYYNKISDSWSTVIYYNTLEDDSLRYPWIKEEMSGDFPADGTFHVSFYQASAEVLDVASAEIAAITGDIQIGGDIDVEFVQKVGEVGKEYAYDAEPIELYTGDAPSNIYQNHIGVGGSLATGWFRKGVTETQELLDLLLQSYMNNYGRTTLKIDGDLMADFDAEDILEDANLTYTRESVEVTPRFMITGGTLNCEAGTWNAEFTEINE